MAKVAASPSRVQPILLGIAGGSGSGKTYLASSIAEELEGQATLLSMDQYFKEVPAHATRGDVNFDHPALLDLRLLIRHVRKLKRGQGVLAPTYDFGILASQPESRPIEPKSVVIVEGLFVLAKPIVDEFDLTCFLDVEADQRLLGRILRDVRERHATMDEIVDRYQRFVKPSYAVFVEPTKQNADVVVDFSFRRILFQRLLVHLLRGYLRGELDHAALAQELRAECWHLGFKPAGGAMPNAIDIFKLATAYPQTEEAVPALS